MTDEQKEGVAVLDAEAEVAMDLGIEKSEMILYGKSYWFAPQMFPWPMMLEVAAANMSKDELLDLCARHRITIELYITDDPKDMRTRTIIANGEWYGD